MARRPNKDMEKIHDQFEEAIEEAETKRILPYSANDLARRFKIAVTTAARWLEELEWKQKGYKWYKK